MPMTSKRFLAAVLCAMLTVSLMSVDAFSDTLTLLVLYHESGDSKLTASVDKLRNMLMYNNTVYTIADIRTPINYSAYSGIILCLGDNYSLDEDTAASMMISGTPLFVINGGGLSELTDTEWHSGVPVVQCLTDQNQIAEVMTRLGGLILPLRGETAGNAGHVFIGAKDYPLYQKVDNIAYFAYFDPSEDILCAAMATALQDWLWPYSDLPKAYGQYVVLDRVYPFFDPDRMMRITDLLEVAMIPYSVSVMPVYSNADYPSMKRFCEWLRYIQSKGARLILHFPLVSPDYVDEKTLREQIRIAYQAYSMYGVYPVAIEMPLTYMHSKSALSLVSGFRTVFLYESSQYLKDTTYDMNISVKDGHQIIAPAWEKTGAFSTAYAQAIYLDASDGVSELNAQIAGLKKSKRSYKDLSEMENTIYIGSDYIRQNDDGGIWLNEKKADTAYYPFDYEEKYEYDRGFEQYLKQQIQASNKLIVFFVLISGTFFASAIMLARRAVRRELILGKKKRFKLPDGLTDEVYQLEKDLDAPGDNRHES